MMEYVYKAGKEGNPIFITLHGTGGDEYNLLPVAEALNADYGALGIRGAVSENGMNRYFKRTGEGVYDLEDLEERGEDLQSFIYELGEKYKFAMEDVILLGFSNGSNIGINLLLRENNEFKQAMLLAPMYPVELDAVHDLSNVRVFLSMGENDPIVPLSESQRVIDIFKERHASIEGVWVNSHEITPQVIHAGKQWLTNNN